MTLNRLNPTDPAWSEFLSALTDAGLPVDDLSDEGQFFFVSDAGVFGGFTLRGPHAMLRSLVAPTSVRGRGEGCRMVEALCNQAAENDASQVWLLTTDATDFFASCGFERASRDDAPQAVRTTRQFASLCPASATLMHLTVVA